MWPVSTMKRMNDEAAAKASRERAFAWWRGHAPAAWWLRAVAQHCGEERQAYTWSVGPWPASKLSDVVQFEGPGSLVV